MCRSSALGTSATRQKLASLSPCYGMKRHGSGDIPEPLSSARFESLPLAEGGVSGDEEER